MAMSAEHRSNFAALHRQWSRLYMSEKFSNGTKNFKQTNNKKNQPTNQTNKQIIRIKFFLKDHQSSWKIQVDTIEKYMERELNQQKIMHLHCLSLPEKLYT